MPWRRSPVTGLLLVLLALPGAGLAQTGAVSVERENFRATPRGVILAEVLQGTVLPLGEAADGWRQAALDGWIWAPSLREERRGGHDLVVAPPEGENLRAGPSGEMIARLRPGMRLDYVETSGNWVRVRRTGWIWQQSLAIQARDPVPAPAPAPAQTPVARTVAETPAPPSSVTGTPSGPGREFATAGDRGLTVLTQPAGDTLARIQSGASVEVLAREGDWARVRVEGWTSMAGGAPVDTATGVLRGISRSDLVRTPDRFRGRLVEWSVQFIALQQAERFRTDFVEGEPFILARGPDDDAGFVYIAVPPERLDEVRRLEPLEQVRILGRIRTARSALTEAPVLDLMELTRGARR
jgi:hypothetical protein